MTNQESKSLGLDQYLKLNTKAYKIDIQNILKDKPAVDVGKENCSHCDPRFRLIFSPEKSRNNLLLEKQISFRSNQIEFRRTFKRNYRYLNTLEMESKRQSERIAKRISGYKSLSNEIDYKLETDIRSGKLFFLPDYLNKHNLKGDEYSIGYLPLLLAFNKNSKSTPIRLVITLNRNGIAKERIKPNMDSNGFIHEDDGDNKNTKHSFSYNDTIRDYELNLLSSTKITLNHLLTISPSYADVKDGFGRIILHPETALSALIFVYKNKDDELPTLNTANAVRDKNNEPILYPAVYSS